MRPVLLTGPTMEPVSLDDIKNHLRVDLADDDELITAYMLTARRTCERIGRKKFVSQTWDLWMDSFVGVGTIQLPKSMSPLGSVVHVKYWDLDDIESTVNAANYIVDTTSQPARIVLKTDQTWPADVLREVNGVDIQVVVGFGDDADVPEEYKQAIKLLVGHFYENREDIIVGSQVHEIPMGVKDLLWLDRNMVF